jgi:tetratricopeptide (TPR) repeat protein
MARAAGAGEEVEGLEARALRFLVMAGDRALGLDVSRADARYAAALELAPPGHAFRPELLAKRADAVRQMGRSPEAATALEQATQAFLARGDRLAAGRAMGTLSSVLMTMGSAGQEEMAVEAVRLLEAEPPGPDLIAAYARMAGVKLVLGDFRETITWVDRAGALAEELGLDVPTRALGFRGYARCSLGDAAGLGEMRAALALAVERGEGRDAAVMHNNLAVALSPIEGPARALEACEEGISFAERRGIREFALAIAAATLDPLVDVGAWDRALGLARTIADQAESSGDVADLIQARWAQTRILAHRGQAEEAAPLAAWLVGAARESGGPEDIIAAFAAASRTYLALGRRDELLDLLAEIERLPHVRDVPTYPASLCELMRIAVAAGDPVLAARLADGLEPVFALHEHALCAADAILLEIRGLYEAAAGRYREAADRWDRFQVVPERAHALLGMARCLLAAGRTAEAVPAARTARDTFDRLGAEPFATQAGDLLGGPVAPPA